MAFDNIVGTTLERYFSSGKAVDNIFSRTAVLDFLKRRGKIDVQGGRQAVHPVMGAKNTTFQNYSGYDTLTPAVDEIIDTAVYQWKQSAIYVPISGMEEAKNSGDKAVINLLKAKTMNAETTAAEVFEEMLFLADGAGTDNSQTTYTPSAKEWAGLKLFTDNTATDVGGINGSAGNDTWWQAHVESTTEALALTRLSEGYNTVSYGSDKCDFEVTTQALYEKYESLLQANQRFTDAGTAKAGFDNLLHKAGVVVWSDYCPSGEWYFLNSRHLKLTVLGSKWMKFNGFIQPYDKDAKYGLILNYGTFATDGRRYLGRHANKS
jgi:hypothetical protein